MNEAKATRRDVLRLTAAGLGWGLAGLTIPGALLRREARAAAPAPLYDAVIQVFYPGGPSQTDTWDPKPGTPNNVFPTIALGANDVYGKPIQVTQHLRKLVDLVHADPAVRLGIVRSVTHLQAEHSRGTACMTTFWGSPVADKYPGVAAVLGRYARTRQPAGQPAVVLQAVGGINDVKGAALEPALAIEEMPATPTAPNPFLPSTSQARLERRARLAERVNRAMRASSPDPLAATWDDCLRSAARITTDGSLARAFEAARGNPLPAGPTAVATALAPLALAGELVQVGVPYVAVRCGANDSHQNNRAVVTSVWGDTTAPAVSELARRLARSGKRCLIVMGGEFGRTPSTPTTGRDGRDHWPHAFSWAFLSVNQPRFKTTALGDTGPDGMATRAAVKDPVRPMDLGGFLYRCLGFDPATPVPTGLGERPPIDPAEEGAALLARFGLGS